MSGGAQEELRRSPPVGFFQGLVWNWDGLWLVLVLVLMVALSPSPDDAIDGGYQHWLDL